MQAEWWPVSWPLKPTEEKVRMTSVGVVDGVFDWVFNLLLDRLGVELDSIGNKALVLL